MMTDNTTTQRRNATPGDASTAPSGGVGDPSSFSSSGGVVVGGGVNNNNGVGVGVGGGGRGAPSSSSSSSHAASVIVSAIASKLGPPLSMLTTRVPSLIALILRVLLRPTIQLSNLLFPPGEYDGVHDANGSERASRAFVDLFRMQISIVRPMMMMIDDDYANVDATGGGGTGGGAGGGGGDRVGGRREAHTVAAITSAVEHYVEPPCPFVPRGYDAIISQITGGDRRPTFDSRPLLLVYLHSPLHPHGVRFLREYLCHPQLLHLLNTNNGTNERTMGGNGGGGGGAVACFGTTVHSADGQRLRDLMGVSRFPFLALLDVKSSTSTSISNDVAMEMMLRMEGPQLFDVSPDRIATYLRTAITRHADLQAAEANRRTLQEDERRLRAEQDAEYREALLADRNREDERRLAMERERRMREEMEEEQRMRISMEASRIENAKSIMERSGGEPPANIPGLARLRFALPNGKRVDRRFRGSVDTVGTLRAFLTVHFHENGIEMRNIGLSTNFPRRTYVEGLPDDALTLEEAELAPQAVIMVQDLDS